MLSGDHDRAVFENRKAVIMTLWLQLTANMGPVQQFLL